MVMPRAHVTACRREMLVSDWPTEEELAEVSQSAELTCQ